MLERNENPEAFKEYRGIHITLESQTLDECTFVSQHALIIKTLSVQER